MLKYTLAWIFIAFSCPAQILPDSLKTDWSHAGMPSIPEFANLADVTAFGAIANDSLNDHAAVAAAIASLGGNAGLVYLPPGFYRFDASLSLPDSVVLRGAGSDSTTLSFNFSGASANSINISGTATSSFLTVLAGYQKGSVAILVSNAQSAFAAGDEVEIRQSNGSWDTNPASWADHSVGHLSKVSGVSGDTLYLEEAFRMDFDSLLFPEIRIIYPRKMCGLECFRITREDGNAPGVNFATCFSYANNCWMRGVESDKSIGAHVAIETSSHIDISGCYFHESFLYDGASTRGYGVMLFSHSTSCKTEDNIFRMLRHAMVLKQGANGNVFGYNYSREPNRSEFPADYGADLVLHGHYPFANLFEGNVGQNLQIDQAWGPAGPFNTFFRNKIENYGLIMSSGTVQSDRQNFIGNDITNTAIFHGFYTLAGSGHFEFGNNVQGNVTPAGTSALADTSYYLHTSTPGFWNSLASLPAIGIPNTSTSATNPAMERYFSGGTLTRCDTYTDTTLITGMQENKNAPFTLTSYRFHDRELSLRLNSAGGESVTVSLYSIHSEKVSELRMRLSQGTSAISIPVVCTNGIYLLLVNGTDQLISEKIIRIE